MTSSTKASAQTLEQLRHLQASHKIITIIKQSKSNIEELIDRLPDLFAIMDSTGLVTKGNYSIAKLLNRNIETALGASLATLFTKRDWDTFLRTLTSLDDSENVVKIELPCRNPSGQERIYAWQVNRVQGTEKLRRLYCVLGSDITELRARERELQALTDNLQELVKEKTADITLLLDSIDRGIFSINNDLVAHEAHSKHAETLFSTTNFKDLPLEKLLLLSAETISNFSQWYKLISTDKGIKKFRQYAKLSPLAQIVFTSPDGTKRDIHIEYRPIIKDGQFQRLMFLCSDITEALRAKEELKRSEQDRTLLIQRLLGLVNNNRISVSIFHEEADKYLSVFRTVNTQEDLIDHVDGLFRDLHTIKGNAGSFGFVELANRAHELEDLLDNIRKQPKTEANYLGRWEVGLARLANEFSEISSLKEMIFSGAKEMMNISRKEYDSLLADLTKGQIKDLAETRRRIYNLNRHPFRDYCHKYNNIIKVCRAKLSKSIDDLDVLTPDVMVHKDVMGTLDLALTHLVRNACDHGIEPETERSALGKGPGTITIALRETDTNVEVTLRDDGGGINTKRVIDIALQRKLITPENAAKLGPEEAFQLLFLPGFSTKEEASAISGRGAGLDAAKTVLDQNKGGIRVSSEIGKGSEFIIFVPRS